MTCIPLLHKLYEVILRLCCLGNWIVRGGIYVLLSILMFWGMSSTQIAGGAVCVLHLEGVGKEWGRESGRGSGREWGREWGRHGWAGHPTCSSTADLSLATSAGMAARMPMRRMGAHRGSCTRYAIAPPTRALPTAVRSCVSIEAMELGRSAILVPKLLA